MKSPRQRRRASRHLLNAFVSRPVCHLLRGDYESNKGSSYTEFSTIIRAIKQEIYADKYAGASVGIYQHNIIARDIGLVDKKESKVKIEGLDKLTDEELDQKIKNAIKNGKD